MELEGRLALGLAEAAEDDAVGEEVDEEGAGEAGGERHRDRVRRHPEVEEGLGDRRRIEERRPLGVT